MASRLVEYYGYPPLSEESVQNAKAHHCPFVGNNCIKTPEDKRLGGCSLQAGERDPVIICPNRLYDVEFQTIREIAEEAFGIDRDLLDPIEMERRRRAKTLTGSEVVVYGKYFGGEVGIPTPGGLEEDEGKGSFKIDFVLAAIDVNASITSFVPIEVQTIDTTNSYFKLATAFRNGVHYNGKWGEDEINVGFNWENVSKRILPQLIYKGHALRRERLCKLGLYFVLPDVVFNRILRRVGGNLLEYPKSAGTITFRTYDLGPPVAGGRRGLVFKRELTTTVEQVAFAFVSPQNLPELGIYETVLKGKFEKLAKKRKLD